MPVRLDKDLSLRLDRAATRLGLTKSALIRVLVKSFVDQLEANGGKITLPLRWQEQERDAPALPLQYVAETKPRYAHKADKR